VVRPEPHTLYCNWIEFVSTNQPCWRNGSAQDFYPIILDRPVILRLWVRAPRGAMIFALFELVIRSFCSRTWTIEVRKVVEVIIVFLLRFWWFGGAALRNLGGSTCQDFDPVLLPLLCPSTEIYMKSEARISGWFMRTLFQIIFIRSYIYHTCCQTK
jgi:hypothetical protein